MRKLTHRLLLATATFTIGLAFSTAWSNISPPQVSICQMASNPRFYDGRTIEVKAAASGVDRGFLLHDCSCKKVLLAVFEDAVAETPEVMAFHAELLSGTSDIRRTEAEVIVTGTFEFKLTCPNPVFRIAVSQMKPLTPAYTLILRSD